MWPAKRRRLETPTNSPEARVSPHAQQCNDTVSSKCGAESASKDTPTPRQSARIRARWELEERKAFLKLLESHAIREFLEADGDFMCSDKYLLAMVLVYFRRLKMKPSAYNVEDFFLALYAANDMEEDTEAYKVYMLPYALGLRWKEQYGAFMKKRDQFWIRLDYNGWVNKDICEKIFLSNPGHWAWKRVRDSPPPEVYNVRRPCYRHIEGRTLWLRSQEMMPSVSLDLWQPSSCP